MIFIDCFSCLSFECVSQLKPRLFVLYSGTAVSSVPSLVYRSVLRASLLARSHDKHFFSGFAFQTVSVCVCYFLALLLFSQFFN